MSEPMEENVERMAAAVYALTQAFEAPDALRAMAVAIVLMDYWGDKSLEVLAENLAMLRDEVEFPDRARGAMQ